ncbi:flavin reductase family protein [Clostridium estertheticum]|uniref:flavin reductase family protein n=1 Tax=Clostridium estertheticum TaxID=238834 RepID=UPI001CF3C413|nr:flavin reductase [Clostridium estertheticum]MCB2353039.1 flavin reductase [Clostridium estertheticum]MCB2360909.1 flavin reductase [Clostridium estertheticum]WAG40335.1 flavin reductase [Clostridium estertheticum]
MKKKFGAKIGLVPYASVVIGTYDENGNPDAMNVGWAMQVGSKEVAINILKHKTLDNLKESKAFTMAFVTKDTMVASDYVGLVSAAKTPNKIEKSGLTCRQSDYVNAPEFEEYPMTFHCDVISITEEFGNTRIVGEIKETTIDDRYLGNDNLPDFRKMGIVWFEDTHKDYVLMGDVAGKAFSVGKKLKEE